MGWHLDGKVTAVVGTHTHVQTADERILPKGTAYLTDVGMTGPHDSIIGVEIEPALGRFLTALPARFETATGNPRLNAVIIEADEADRPRDRHRAPQPTARTTSSNSRIWPMTDLFDLPFEEEPDARAAPVAPTRAVADGAPARRSRTAARPTTRRTPVRAGTARLLRHRADRPRSRSARRPSSSKSGSRASSRTAASGTPAICTSR